MSDNSSRLPALQVLVAGVPIAGVVEVHVSSDSYMGADRFHLVAAMDATGYDIWSSENIEVNILLGIDGELQTLITGVVDRIDVDVGNRLVVADGRDLTARFIEARTQETFENRTASEIVAALAERRGLMAQATPTLTLVGRNFDGDHAQTTLDQYSSTTTEWDLLARLADAEGFDIWVDGKTLNFAPPYPGLGQTVLTPQDCMELRLERLLPLAGDLQVVVKSWDSRAQETIVQSAGGVSGSASSRSYVLIRPNMSATDAARLATRTLTQMTQNSRVVTMELPGDVITRPRQSLVLNGTGTDFDGTYVVTSVERRLSFTHGFTQTLQARTPPWIASSIT